MPQRIAWTALLLLPALVVFTPGLHYPFLSLDDGHHIAGNPAIHDLSWRGIRYIFFEDTRDLRYFPLLYLSWAVDHWLFGSDPFPFHRTNLILHLANTVLVAWLVERIFHDRALAFFTALLFSIHPLQVESVAWLSSRKNVLFLFFFLLAAHAYLARFRPGSESRRIAILALALSALCYGLACLSKTPAITLPAALVLVDWVVDPACRSSLATWIRRSLPSKLVYVPVLVFVVWVSFGRDIANPFQTDYGFRTSEWVVIVSQNLFFYVQKSLLPSHLAVFVPLPPAGALPPQMYLFAVFGLGIVGVTIWSWWRGHVQLVFGLGWYLVTISPLVLFAAIFSDIPILVADRYYYQSALGLLLLPAAAGLHVWRTRPRLRPIVGAVSVACLLTLIVVASVHRMAWRSTTALYEKSLTHHPNREFFIRLALEYQEAGRLDDALRALDAADRAENQIFFMNFLFQRLRIVQLRLLRDDLRGAAEDLKAGIESTPNAFEPYDARTPVAYIYLAELQRRAGDEEGAARSLADAREATRDDSEHNTETATQFLSQEANRFLLQGANRFLADRTQANPDDAEAWFYYGLVAKVTANEHEARLRFERARALGYIP